MDLIIKHVPAPAVDEVNEFAMLATLLDYDSYLGRCLTGKVISGSAKINDQVKAINLDSDIVENGRLTKLFKFEGTSKTPVDEVAAYDSERSKQYLAWPLKARFAHLLNLFLSIYKHFKKF